MSDERTPFVLSQNSYDNPHTQFCELVGIPPSNEPPGVEHQSRPTTLYERATRERHSQSVAHMVTAALSGTLLLTQIIIGATLTALGASSSSHVIITIFGVSNTIIAGVIAYMKSQGQPMRAQMFRADLERVVDEIENSEVMFLGISKGMSGYDEMKTRGHVTVRSEVARLTRLYDQAVKTNTANIPETYSSGGSSTGPQAASSKEPSSSHVPLPGSSPLPPAATTTAGAIDLDDSPATAVVMTKTPGVAPKDHENAATSQQTLLAPGDTTADHAEMSLNKETSTTL